MKAYSSLNVRPAPRQTRSLVPWVAAASFFLCLVVLIISTAPPAAAGKGPDYAGGTLTFLRLFTEHKFDDAYAYLSDDTAKKITADKLRKVWTMLEDQAGPFQGFGTPSVTVEEKLHSVDVPMRFLRLEVTWRVSWDESGAVARFFSTSSRELTSPSSSSPAASASASPSTSPDSAKAAPEFPPYADPARYHEEDVVIGQDPWKLPGTLTLPTAGATAPFPVVVLVHGSGPNNRDEAIGPNKPFRDLAFGLASKGIAVLRYDKRTMVYRTQVDVKQVTVKEETLDDVSAALRYLQDRKELDPKRVFVLGHSLGAELAPVVAQDHPELAGVILLAPSARPLLTAMADQLKYLRSISTDSTEIGAIDAMLKQAQEAMNPQLPDSALVLGGMAALHYFRDLDARKPLEAAARLKMPLFCIQGGRDYQVTDDDFAEWKKALAGSPKAEFRRYADLNHLFLKGEGKSTPAEYVIPGHVAPEVVQDLSAWILAH
jgi:uncharacterized protein